jgi:hypothetical protein
MSLERASGGTSFLDVLDRVLDKGIVIDAWWRISLEIDHITIVERAIIGGHVDARPAPGKSLLFDKFGSAASSHSARRKDDDEASGPSGSDSRGKGLGPNAEPPRQGPMRVHRPRAQEQPTEGIKDLLH